jgi:diacylglycerol diphosphate phosphatase/phosphatidate phosphatase
MMCVCFWPPFSSSTNSQRKNNSNWNLACTATCAIFVSTGLSELTTQILKAYVGRLRPNFYALCEFSLETKLCLASAHDQEEARQSFPSGHSSLSMQGMLCLSLFLVGQLLMVKKSGLSTTAAMSSTNNVNNTNRRPSMGLAFFAAVVPIWVSLFVGASRLVDTWHHPSDVLAGWLLGGWSAIVAYHYYFSSPLIQLFYNLM